MTDRIESVREVNAPPERVHDLLVDVEAWALWSPHIASVTPSSGRVQTGWRGLVRAWFSPLPTEMVVDRATAGRGIAWHSRGLGHTLRYENEVTPWGAGGSRVRFSARVEGPLGPLVTRVARPLSAYGQRRRLTRLDALARLESRRAA